MSADGLRNDVRPGQRSMRRTYLIALTGGDWSRPASPSLATDFDARAASKAIPGTLRRVPHRQGNRSAPACWSAADAPWISSPASTLTRHHGHHCHARVRHRSLCRSLLTGLLAAVAGVSLLVGGIGIMIHAGLRYQAHPRDPLSLAIGVLEQVLMQFLVEAVVLLVLGGLISIVLDMGLAGMATRALQIPLIIKPTIILIAFGFSPIVGVVFGYFPTRRAAHLAPIGALRHE